MNINLTPQQGFTVWISFCMATWLLIGAGMGLEV